MGMSYMVGKGVLGGLREALRRGVEGVWGKTFGGCSTDLDRVCEY